VHDIYLKKSDHSIPKVELNSKFIYFWSQGIFYMKKENLFPTSCINIVTFITCLSFFRLIRRVSNFFFTFLVQYLFFLLVQQC